MNIIDVFFKPAISLIIAYVVIYFIETGAGIHMSWFYFAGKAILFTAVYTGLNLFVFKQFDKYDIDLIKGYVPFLKSK